MSTDPIQPQTTEEVTSMQFLHASKNLFMQAKMRELAMKNNQINPTEIYLTLAVAVHSNEVLLEYLSSGEPFVLDQFLILLAQRLQWAAAQIQEAPKILVPGAAH